MVKYIKEEAGPELVVEPAATLASTIDHFSKTAESPQGPGPEPGALPGGEEFFGFNLLKNGKILREPGRTLGIPGESPPGLR